MAFTCKLGIKTATGEYKYIDYLKLKASFFTSDAEVVTNLYNVAFNRKIYSPNELIADLVIVVINQSDEETKKKKLASITNSELKNAFLDKEVTLVITDSSNSNRTHTFNNLYVHQYIPLREQDKALYVRLKAYSFDFQLTQQEYCHSYVAKRVYADILKKEIEQTDADNKKTNEKWINVFLAKKHKISVADNTELQHMTYNKDKEYILPYMVQYNESFYDFLCRTANRCGEFVFFDEGSLYYGLKKEDDSDGFDKSISSSECSQSYGKNLEHVVNDYFTVNDVNGEEDFKFTADDWTANWKRDYKSKNSLAKAKEIWKKEKGNENYPSDKDLQKLIKKKDGIRTKSGENDLKYNFEINENEHQTKIYKNKFSAMSLFTGWDAKYLTDMVANILKQSTLYNIIKSLLLLTINVPKNAQKSSNSMQDRWENQVYNRFTDNEDYLPINSNLQIEDDAVSPFVAIDGFVTNDDYMTIRNCELSASEQAMTFNLGTNYKKMKLGQKVKVGDEEYIVVQVMIMPAGNPAKFVGIDNDYPEDFNSMSGSQMQVVAVPLINNKVYPPMHPKGHVRYAEPQVAFVPTHGYMDPRMQGRLRISYPWDSEKNVSPWLRVMVPSATDGSGFYAEASKGDEVLVCYFGGNVERPYIGGFLRNRNRAISFKRGNMTMMSKNGHGIGFYDPVDPSLFFEGLSPTLKTLKSITQSIPGVTTFFRGGIDAEDTDSTDQKNLIKLSGGTAIRDANGIYSINMSTDQRKIDISSPFGKVSLNAFTGISISAPNGDISIKGKNVSIEASNSVKIESGKYIKQGFLEKDVNFNAKDILTASGKLMLELAGDAFLKDLIQPIDMEVLRSVVEIFFHPVSGTMQIKSHNYMLLESGTGSATIAPDRYKDTSTLHSEAIKKNEKARKAVLGFEGAINYVNTNVDTVFNGLIENLRKARKSAYMYKLFFSNEKWLLEDKPLNLDDLITELFNKSYAQLSDQATRDNYQFGEGDDSYKRLKIKTDRKETLAARVLPRLAKNVSQDFISLFLSLKKIGITATYDDLVKSAQMVNDDDFRTLYFNELKDPYVAVLSTLFEDLERWTKLTVTPAILKSQKALFKHRILAKLFNAVKDEAGYKATVAYDESNDNWAAFVRSIAFKGASDGVFKKWGKELVKPWQTFINDMKERDVWDSTKSGQILFSEKGDTTYYFDENGSMHRYLNGFNETDEKGNYVSHNSVKQLFMDVQ